MVAVRSDAPVADLFADKIDVHPGMISGGPVSGGQAKPGDAAIHLDQLGVHPVQRLVVLSLGQLILDLADHRVMLPYAPAHETGIKRGKDAQQGDENEQDRQGQKQQPVT